VRAGGRDASAFGSPPGSTFRYERSTGSGCSRPRRSGGDFVLVNRLSEERQTATDLVIVLDDDAEMRFNLGAGLPIGAYDLEASDAEGLAAVLENAFFVVAPRSGEVLWGARSGVRSGKRSWGMDSSGQRGVVVATPPPGDASPPCRCERAERPGNSRKFWAAGEGREGARFRQQVRNGPGPTPSPAALDPEV
jgi:hypothetical protein